jgi:hypothetical protein
MRVRDSMREALATRAAANQRSISEEAEHLLELAMQVQGASLGEALDLAFDSYAAAVAIVVGRVAYMVGGNSGTDEWLSNPYAFAKVEEGVREVFEAMRPRGDVAEPRIPTGKFAGLSLIATAEGRALLGRGLANGALSEIAKPYSGRRQSRWAQLAAERLPSTTLEQIRKRLSIPLEGRSYA